VIEINLFGSWSPPAGRHIGYIMVIYLAGWKSVDPSLGSGQGDGATSARIFFRAGAA